MGKKRGRGRPSVTEILAGEHSGSYEAMITQGKRYRSKRSIADVAYAFTVSILLTKANPPVEDLELICGEDYQCRSILNKLGRMLRIDGYSEKDVIEIAKVAIKGKKEGYSVKEIEQYIKHGRKTGEW